MNGRGRTWILTAVLCLAAAGLGYLLAGGRSAFGNASGREEGADRTEGSGASVGKGSNLSLMTGDSRGSHRLRSDAELVALKRDLRGRFDTSPFAWEDWALREQTAAVLATMSAEELQAFATEMESELGDSSFPSTTSSHALLREIMRQWALKDPAAASLCAARHPKWPESRVFEDWLKRDLTAAEAWLKSGKFSESDKAALDKLRKSFLTRKASGDFDSARQYWSTLDQKNRNEVLIEWGKSLANDPARRSELLRLLQENGDEEVRLNCYKTIAGAMAVKSPKDAVEFVEASDLPEAGKDALYDKVLGNWSEQDPKAALEWWKGLGQQEIPSKGLMGGVFMMAMTSPDEISTWVKDLPAGPAKEAFEDGLLENLVKFNIRKAADFSASIEDPSRRHKHLREVYRQFSGRNSGAASKWLNTLPEEDRAAVRNP